MKPLKQKTQAPIAILGTLLALALSAPQAQADEGTPPDAGNAFTAGTGNVALSGAEIEALQQFINRSKVALEDALRQAEGQNSVNTYAILRQAIRQVVMSSSGNEPHRELILRVLLNQALELTDGVPAANGQGSAAQPILPANTADSVKAMVLKASTQLALQFVVADQANLTAAQASPAPYLNAANQRLSMAFNWSQTIMSSGAQIKMLVTILQHWLNTLTLPQFGQLPQLAEVVLRVQNTLSLAHAGINDRGQHPLIRTRVVRDIRSILDQGNGWVRILDPNAPIPTPAPQPQAQTQTTQTDSSRATYPIPLTGSSSTAYSWGRDAAGKDRCYPARGRGQPLAGSHAVYDTYCIGEWIYAWGVNSSGIEGCHYARETGVALQGRSEVDLSYCGNYYAWGVDSDGNEKCYAATRDGRILRGRRPVAHSYCQR